jgi:hypothetical protein
MGNGRLLNQLGQVNDFPRGLSYPLWVDESETSCWVADGQNGDTPKKSDRGGFLQTSPMRLSEDWWNNYDGYDEVGAEWYDW